MCLKNTHTPGALPQKNRFLSLPAPGLQGLKKFEIPMRPAQFRSTGHYLSPKLTPQACYVHDTNKYLNGNSVHLHQKHRKLQTSDF